MPHARTPFRQLAKLYSAVLATAQASASIDGRTEATSASFEDSFSRLGAHLADSEKAAAERAATLRSQVDSLTWLVNGRQFAQSPQTAAKELAELREHIRRTMPDNVAAMGWNSYAQCDEDGIIRECLDRISRFAPLSRTFIEVGCSDGYENNTHQLLLDSYRGCWLDGAADKIGRIARDLGSLSHRNLLVKCAFATLATIDPIMEEFVSFLGAGDPDFFSFDTDGNDPHLVTRALSLIQPKLLCVEYNGKFPPPTSLVMNYAEQHEWASDDYYGATLQSWVDLLHGYTLVSCNLSGVNAFFVRNDLLRPFTIYETSKLYQPPRYWLVGTGGHPASMKWLRQACL